MAGEDGHEKVAVVVVHGIADQVRGVTAEAVATQLAAHTGSSVSRSDRPIAVEPLEPAVRFVRWEPKTRLDRIRKSWRQSLRSDFLDPSLGGAPPGGPPPPPTEALRNSAASVEGAGEPPVDRGVRYTDYLLAKAASVRHQAPPPAPFEMPSFQFETHHRKVDVFEMHWADLSRLSTGVMQIITELFILLFHLCELGAETLAVAVVAAEPSKVLTGLSRCHRWASWLFTRGLALMFLQLLMCVLWLVPFALLAGHEREAGMAAAVLLGLALAVVLVYRWRRPWVLGFWVAVPTTALLAWGASQQPGQAAWAVALIWLGLQLWGYQRLLVFCEWRFRAVYGAGWVLMWFSLATLAWGAAAHVELPPSALDALNHTVLFSHSPDVSARLVAGVLGVVELWLVAQLFTWAVMAALVTGAVVLGEHACGGLLGTPALRQSVVTARLGLFASIGIFLAFVMTVWALLANSLQQLVDCFQYTPWWFKDHDAAMPMNAKQFLLERFTNSTDTFALVSAMLLALLGFVALIFLPSVLVELRLANAWASSRLGNWLTAGYRALDRLVRWWSCLIVPLLLGAVSLLVVSQFVRNGVYPPCVDQARLMGWPWQGALAVVLVLLLLAVVPNLLPKSTVQAGSIMPRLQRWSRQWSGVLVALGLGAVAVLVGSQMAPMHETSYCASMLNLSLGDWSGDWLATLVKWIAGGAVGLVAIGRVAIKQLQAVRAPLDAALDVDNHFREFPRRAIPRVRIFERYVAVLEHVMKGGYDRVVIVAHSQGTVITADLLRYLQRRDRLRPAGVSANPDRLARLAKQLAGYKLRLLTCGSPLRQLYALRFPTRYDWVIGSPPGPGVGPSGPHPWQDVGVASWVNVWGAGDYVGRWLWTPARDTAIPALAVDPQAYEGKPVQQVPDYRDLCLGADAHTHYFDLDNKVMLDELRALI